ncbi:MAG: hypothetical protein EBR82_74090, partial [Caulobacteraceae bacterium]|nr:hypothetical protein [Caulobacteraceae bacterium]
MAAKNFGRVNVSITASTGGLTAGLNSAGKQLKTFGSSAGGLSGVMKTLGGSMGGLLPVFGAFTTAAGAIAALTSATHAAEALHNLSQELGVATGDLQVMQQAAAESGVSQELLTTGLRRTTRMVGELAMGTPAAAKAFAQLGLTMQDMAGLSVSQQFALISQRIAALPPQMQAAAAIDIFGRSGQGMLNFIRSGSESIGEIDTLLTQLGVKMSGEQVAAIEGMGDAIGRLTLPMQGFINQFLAELAPAVTAVSQILLEFFTSSNTGFSFAKLFADGLIVALKGLVAIGSILVGTFQMFKALLIGIAAAATTAFGGIATAVGAVLEFLGQIIPGLQSVGQGISQFGEQTQMVGDALFQEANSAFGAALENFANPLQGFDQKMADAQRQAADSAVKPVEAAAMVAGQIAGEQITRAVGASSQALKAIVAGTSEGEAFRNSLIRGADPRNAGNED